jgi:Na+-transporting NADH:ubiquinone oxidoreductase subunit NqrE
MSLRTGVALVAVTAALVGVLYVVGFDYPLATALTTGVGAGAGVALSYGVYDWLRRRT